MMGEAEIAMLSSPPFSVGHEAPERDKYARRTAQRLGRQSFAEIVARKTRAKAASGSDPKAATIGGTVRALAYHVKIADDASCPGKQNRFVGDAGSR